MENPSSSQRLGKSRDLKDEPKGHVAFKSRLRMDEEEEERKRKRAREEVLLENSGDRKRKRSLRTEEDWRKRREAWGL